MLNPSILAVLRYQSSSFERRERERERERECVCVLCVCVCVCVCVVCVCPQINLWSVCVLEKGKNGLGTIIEY